MLQEHMRNLRPGEEVDGMQPNWSVGVAHPVCGSDVDRYPPFPVVGVCAPDQVGSQGQLLVACHCQ